MQYFRKETFVFCTQKNYFLQRTHAYSLPFMKGAHFHSRRATKTLFFGGGGGQKVKFLNFIYVEKMY